MVYDPTIYFGVLALLGLMGMLAAWQFRKRFPILASICTPRFLGIGLSDWSLGYYTLITVLGLFLLWWPEYLGAQAFFLLLLTTGAFFLFSLYFAFVQAVTREPGAAWSICGAVLNLLVLIAVYLSVPVADLADFLLTAEASLVVILGFAIAIGVGGAALTNILFFKFLSDFIISKEEYEVLKVIAQVTAVALVAVLMFGLALLYTPAAEPMVAESILLGLLGIALINVLAEVCLNFWIGPAIVKISFDEPHFTLSEDLNAARRLAFALGAVSMVSWFAMMVLITLRDLDLNIQPVMTAYAVFVILAVVISQLIDRSLVNENSDEQDIIQHPE